VAGTTYFKRPVFFSSLVRLKKQSASKRLPIIYQQKIFTVSRSVQDLILTVIKKHKNNNNYHLSMLLFSYQEMTILLEEHKQMNKEKEVYS